jgi:hypothetical protein
MSERRTVHVKLLKEAVDVWRPVEADHLRGDEYRLTGPIPEGEVWAFQPGEVVCCRAQLFPDGTTAIVALARVENDA